MEKCCATPGHENKLGLYRNRVDGKRACRACYNASKRGPADESEKTSPEP